MVWELQKPPRKTTAHMYRNSQVHLSRLRYLAESVRFTVQEHMAVNLPVGSADLGDGWMTVNSLPPSGVLVFP